MSLLLQNENLYSSSNPTPEQITAFRSTAEMYRLLQTLLRRNKVGELISWEPAELDE